MYACEKAIDGSLYGSASTASNIITESPYDYFEFTCPSPITINTVFFAQYVQGPGWNAATDELDYDIYVSDSLTYGTTTLCASTHGFSGWF